MVEKGEVTLAQRVRSMKRSPWSGGEDAKARVSCILNSGFGSSPARRRANHSRQGTRVTFHLQSSLLLEQLYKANETL